MQSSTFRARVPEDECSHGLSMKPRGSSMYLARSGGRRGPGEGNKSQPKTKEANQEKQVVETKECGIFCLDKI